jgi:hypothetical protein
MRNRILSTVVVTLALAATPLLAKGTHSHKPAAVRIESMSQNAGNVNLKLADGRSIDVPETAVHFFSRASKDQTAATTGTKHAANSHHPSLASFDAATTPAFATVIYAKDGTIRKVKIQVAESGDAPAAAAKAKAGSQ